MENLLQYLPNSCSNVDAITKSLLEQESDSFIKFNDQLDLFDPDYIKDEERFKIYDAGQLILCQNETSLELFVQCSIERRNEMTKVLEELKVGK